MILVARPIRTTVSLRLRLRDRLKRLQRLLKPPLGHLEEVFLQGWGHCSLPTERWLLVNSAVKQSVWSDDENIPPTPQYSSFNLEKHAKQEDIKARGNSLKKEGDTVGEFKIG